MANGNMKAHLGRFLAWPTLRVVIGMAACGGSDTDPPTTTPATPVPTWNKDIGPLMQANCATCHYPGGSGHFDLLKYENAKSWAPAALSALKSGRMPPWPPAPDCRDYVGSRALPDGAVEKFEAWATGGMPAGDGDIKSFMPRQFEKLRADLTGKMTEAYTPDVSVSDDYRCFVLDVDFPTDTWVEGVDVSPGTPQVHHVLTYALNGSERDAAIQADADTAGSGYACFGGPVPVSAGGPGTANLGSFPILVGAWVPGFQAQAFPSGSALLVPAGSRLIMQVHYNTDGASAAPDQTSLSMQTRPTPPTFFYRAAPIAQLKLDINAGDAASQHSITIKNWSAQPTTVVGVGGHMHDLGTNIRGTILHTSNKEECLLDIPDWDFQWQMQYQFPTTAFAMVQPGDSVQLDCVYDNSAENQPMVGGVKQTPKDVKWGEGTLDEMCLMYLSTITPLPNPKPAPTTACGAASECIQACNPRSLSCMADCEKVSTECLGCTVNTLLGCGALACGLGIQAAQDCVVNCALSVNVFGGSMKSCVTATCPNEWSALAKCMDPFFVSPSCSTGLAACGI